MAKKQKRNLQKLIDKKQQLTQASHGSVLSFAAVAPQTPVTPAVQTSTTHSDALVAPTSTGRELRKTAISVILIAVLLIAAVVADHKTPYFSRFGDKLYTTLRLQS